MDLMNNDKNIIATIKNQTKYKEIFRLAEMLDNAHLDYCFGVVPCANILKKELYTLTYGVCKSKLGYWISVSQGIGCIGAEENKLEILYCGFPKITFGNGVVQGNLSAEDVFNLIMRYKNEREECSETKNN